MAMRTCKTTVVFSRSFVLRGFGEELPAGSYEVETDEELLEGVSFAAYRRTSVLMHLQPDPGQPGVRQVVTVDPKELDAALVRDRAAVRPGGEP